MKEIEYDKPVVERVPTPRSEAYNHPHNLRTFQDDVAQLTQQEQLTRAQVLIAEANRREERGEERTREKPNTGHPLNKALLGLGLMFAFLLGISFYVLLGRDRPIMDSAGQTPLLGVTVIEKDANKDAVFVPIRDPVVRSATLSSVFGKTTLANDTSKEIVYTLEKDSEQPIGVGDFFELIAPFAPNTLTRSLQNPVQAGIYQSSQLDGYLILNTRSYPNAFSGMYGWEQLMAENLLPLLDPYFSPSAISNLLGVTFTDIKIAGTNVRALSDESGKTVLVYGFPDDSHVLITTGEESYLTLAKQFEK